MGKKVKKVKTYYRFLNCSLFESTEKPSDFVVGFYWILTIGLFPVWIWLYMFYKLTAAIGRLLNQVKVIKHEYEEEEDKNTYY